MSPRTPGGPPRGVNLGGWFSQLDAIEGNDPDSFPGLAEHLRGFLGPADAQRVRAWGFDHVRLPLDWHVAFAPDTLTPREDVLALLDAAVDTIVGEGLKVILDLHRCPGHDFHQGMSTEQPLFTEPARREDCLRIWSHLGARYGRTPGIVLELLNEPVAPTSALWNEVQAELAREVRRLAPEATLVLASNLWNNTAEFERLTPVVDDNVVYSFHFYSPIVFTHQLAPWLEGDVFRVRRSYPGRYELPEGTGHRLPLEHGAWDSSRLARHLDPVLRFRERHDVPVCCGEFGVYAGGADRRSQLAWMSDTLALFGAHHIGWTYWNYKNLDFGLVSEGERRFAHSPQYANPDRVDWELLRLLTGRGA